jgi:hypothetical protein
VVAAGQQRCLAGLAKHPTWGTVVLPLHPYRLRCGWAVPVALHITDDPAALRRLTEDEAAAYFPGLAADLRLNGMLCPGAWFAPQEECEAMAAPR